MVLGLSIYGVTLYNMTIRCVISAIVWNTDSTQIFHGRICCIVSFVQALSSMAQRVDVDYRTKMSMDRRKQAIRV